MTKDEPGALTPGIATAEPAVEEQAHDQHASITTRLAAVQ